MIILFYRISYEHQKENHCRCLRISGVISLCCLALASSSSAALLISSSDWLYCLASVRKRQCQATESSPSCAAKESRYSVRRVRTLRGRVQCLLRRAERQWVVGVEGGRSISFSIATEALITGMDILLNSDSTTFTSRISVPSSHSSNMIPLNHAFVLYSAFFSASYRCTFSFLLLPRSRRTAGTSQALQNSSARTGSKFEAKMFTACAIACEVHSSGRVSASTSRQRSRLGMILNALGTFPLRYLLKILPIYPYTRFTQGLSSDFCSISFSFRSRALSQSAWLSSGPNPRISSNPSSLAETFPPSSCCSWGLAISTTSFSSVAARRRRWAEACFFLTVLSLRLRSTALWTLRTRLWAFSLFDSTFTFLFSCTFFFQMPIVELLIKPNQPQIIYAERLPSGQQSWQYCSNHPAIVFHRVVCFNQNHTYFCIQTLKREMDITLPKVRDPAKWRQNAAKISQLELRSDSIEFREYCKLCFMFIEADNSVFQGSKYRKQIEFLLKPKITYQSIISKQSSKKDEAVREEQVAERIGKTLAYSWKTIIDLIKGKLISSQDPGIYSDENININFARLEKMLVELQNHNYRCSIFTKENAYLREMMEKEMEEEIVFIKLLQNILQTQTKRIQDTRKASKEPQKQREAAREEKEEPEEEEEQEEKLPDIREVVKVNEYFERKLASMKELANTTKDPIDRLYENRKFNAAAVRFHLHHTHARR